LKSSRRDKATAVAVVALLHGAALLCVLQSMQQTRSQPRPTVALAPTLIRVALETIDAPKPALPRALHRTPPSTAPARESSPQNETAVSIAIAPASAPSPVRKQADAPTTDVAYLENPPPTYPAASLRIREQGRVLVSVLVSGQGAVEEAAVKVSSGFPRLDAAALMSVRAWRFVPAQRAGIAIEARINVPVRFELSED
jgi:periplasmic protein TonB